jgi:hypothetical protein
VPPQLSGPFRPSSRATAARRSLRGERWPLSSDVGTGESSHAEVAGFQVRTGVRTQYDTPAFREHCKRLAAPVAAQIRADLGRSARVVIVGIDGSPSMGVELTASSDDWGGRPDKPRDEDYPVVPGAGIFTETLLGMLKDDLPNLGIVGIGHDLLDYDEEEELAKLERALPPARGANAAR